MAIFEVIISNGKPEESIILGHSSRQQHVSSDAWHYLTEAADRGELPRPEGTPAYGHAKAPPKVLIGMLEHLGEPHDWVDIKKVYRVSFFEVDADDW